MNDTIITSNAVNITPEYSTEFRQIANGLWQYLSKYDAYKIKGTVEIRIIPNAKAPFGFFFPLTDDPKCIVPMVELCLQYKDDKGIKGIYLAPNPSSLEKNVGQSYYDLTKDDDVTQCYHLLIVDLSKMNSYYLMVIEYINGYLMIVIYL